MGNTNSNRPSGLTAGGRKLLSVLFSCFTTTKKHVVSHDYPKVAGVATGAFASSGTTAATTELMGGVVIVVGRGAAANKPAAGGGSFTANNVGSPEVVAGLGGGGGGGSPTKPPAGVHGAAFTNSDRAPEEVSSMDSGSLVNDGDGGASAYSCSYATALSDLTDDLIEDILLRLSPKERGCRERVSLVCRSWHRIVNDPGYRHRSPPLHGTSPSPSSFE